MDFLRFTASFLYRNIKIFAPIVKIQRGKSEYEVFEVRWKIGCPEALHEDVSVL
jgi:hypothetical protein